MIQNKHDVIRASIVPEICFQKRLTHDTPAGTRDIWHDVADMGIELDVLSTIYHNMPLLGHVESIFMGMRIQT